MEQKKKKIKRKKSGTQTTVWWLSRGEEGGGGREQGRVNGKGKKKYGRWAVELKKEVEENIIIEIITIFKEEWRIIDTVEVIIRPQRMEMRKNECKGKIKSYKN